MGVDTASSDSLFVHLLPSADGTLIAGKTLAKLEQFGDVSRMEVTRAKDVPGVLVSYFDLRAAASAKAVLGSACEEAPCHGRRHLRYTGKADFDDEVAMEVSKVIAVGNDDFLVEFWYSRAAVQAAALAGGKLEQYVAPKPPPAEAKTTIVGTAKPRYVDQLRLSQVRWEDLANHQERRTVLQLRGLPPRLCQPGALKALMLAQGLLDKVARLSIAPGRLGRPGCAKLYAKGIDEVSVLTKFFHGRQFGGSSLVAVSFAADQGLKPLGAEPWRIGIKEAFKEFGRGPELGTESTRSNTPRESSHSGGPPEEPAKILPPPPGLAEALMDIRLQGPLTIVPPPGLETCGPHLLVSRIF